MLRQAADTGPNCPENRQAPAGTSDTPFDTLRTGERRLVATRFLTRRAQIVGVGLATCLPIVWLSKTPPLQAAALTVGVGLMATFFTVEALLNRRGRVITQGAFFTSLCVTLAGLTVACLVTGGIHSPFVPILFAPSVTAFAAFGDRRRRATLLAAVISSWVLLAAVPAPFPSLPDGALPLLRVIGCVISVALLYASVTTLSDGLVRAGTRAQSLTDQLMQQAIERSRDVEALSARLAHELNNPLSAIKGLLQLEARSTPDNRRLQVALAEVGRMQQLTEGYLAQAISPQLTLAATPVDDLFTHLSTLLAHRVREAQVELRCEPSSLVLHADKARLHEALLNLLLNAIEATPPGGLVALSASKLADGHRLEVRDTGRGMTPEHLRQLGTPGASGRTGGHGLGVAAAKAVAQAHAGRLSYESAPDQGTLARLDLPGAPS